LGKGGYNIWKTSYKSKKLREDWYEFTHEKKNDKKGEKGKRKRK